MARSTGFSWMPLALVVAISTPLGAGAQEPDTVVASAGASAETTAEVHERPEERAERSRREAGLRAGYFQARGLTEIEGGVTSATPVLEGYFQKGLDKHLAIESSIGFWRRTQQAEGRDGFFGAEGGGEMTSYLVPLMTSVKVYPFSEAGDSFQPYATGGVGFALGIDDRENTASFMGVGGSDGTAILTGFGFKAGLGVDMRLGAGFGLGAGARYQWNRFGAELGGNRTYQGLALDGGVVYRMQF